MTIPFVDGGRDLSGCDCWGLIRLAYEDRLGISLPSYGEISSEDLLAISDQMSQGSSDAEVWREADAPREFDVCVMAWFGKKQIGHVGIMLDGARVLHTEAHAGPMIAPIDHFSIKRRIAFFRRHKALCNAIG